MENHVGSFYNQWGNIEATEKVQNNLDILPSRLC